MTSTHWIMLAAGISLALVGERFLAADSEQDDGVLVAEEIRLVDATGQTRLRLSARDDSGSLELRDEHDRLRMAFEVTPDGAATISLRDAEGRVAFNATDSPTPTVWVGERGSMATVGLRSRGVEADLVIGGADDNLRVALAHALADNQEGEANTLVFFDSETNQQVMLIGGGDERPFAGLGLGAGHALFYVTDPGERDNYGAGLILRQAGGLHDAEAITLEATKEAHVLKVNQFGGNKGVHAEVQPDGLPSIRLRSEDGASLHLEPEDNND